MLILVLTSFWSPICRSVSGNMLAVSGGDNKVSLWKETLEGQWVCISDVSKGHGGAVAAAQG